MVELVTHDEDEVPMGVERVVEAARQLVTAADGMLGASFWSSYGYLRSEIEEFDRKLGAPREADGTLSKAKCECGHQARNHVMMSQTQRCEATVYTDAPLGGGSAFPCPCRQFTEQTS